MVFRQKECSLVRNKAGLCYYRQYEHAAAARSSIDIFALAALAPNFSISGPYIPCASAGPDFANLPAAYHLPQYILHSSCAYIRQNFADV